uniref:Uncharacterized protein n=1 Tax=Anguilla anguilla TaxID=7936 RepID=A0A0E9XKU6_ANGAN
MWLETPILEKITRQIKEILERVLKIWVLEIHSSKVL